MSSKARSSKSRAASKKGTVSAPAEVPFHPSVVEWFGQSFDGPTRAQQLGWPAISSGDDVLLLAPTGSGKTLTAFLWAIDRLMFRSVPPVKERCRVIYVSPLKALAVDIERNLRAPLAGIARVANAGGDSFHLPTVGVRTGDTPSSERSRFVRQPTDILITTPESLFLLLTSAARDVLRSVETVIIDEIHALVPTKRGSHLALSLERLEHLAGRHVQRIGLSATQRPLEEVARFLGGHASAAEWRPRPVTIVDTGEKKRLDLRIEVPVEDMAELGSVIEVTSGPASVGETRTSIWPAIHPRLVELIRSHRTTIIFVNSRRLAERLAAAINEIAEETVALAHHGSIAREQRVEIEDDLKEGRLPAIIATSSLELGIDMGAIDLVVQIEAPPSIASGLQRIGRASHQAGAVSSGIIVPKYRADLLACAAIAEAMQRSAIEPIRYPRNPLDVLSQQIVATVSMDPWDVDALYDLVRGAAPWADLARESFEGVLDMLSGVYPSSDFAELRPRITWDRISGEIKGRESSKRVVVNNAGTIPDRGLYGVFLAGAEKPVRVGELDEEMVFECREGETFVLGASTWRIEEIRQDRVLVSPAPGEPGKMPFWHGDAAGRSVDLGRAIGALTRRIVQAEPSAAIAELARDHALDERAASNLVRYVSDQLDAAGAAPDDRTIVVERIRDELGDWRICVLSPLGGRVLAPWALASIAAIRSATGFEVEAMWSDDGFILRFPDVDEPPDVEILTPEPEELERLLLRQLGGSALFAARFREAAARALLLPRRRAGTRAPLWQQRKRAADLLHVAAGYPSFPIVLEAFRESLRDVFDLPALQEILHALRSRRMRLKVVDTEQPSPFAASVLFRYVANYIYDGDAPLAERKAQVLSIDHAQLRELMGEIDLRELLDDEAIESTVRMLQRLDADRGIHSADALHDLLLSLGDLTPSEIERRSEGDPGPWLDALAGERRALLLPIGGEKRWIAAEDAGRYRDALGTPLPTGLPKKFLERVDDPVGDLVRRWGRSHGPFGIDELAGRWSVGAAVVERTLHRLAEQGRLIEGEFTPGGAGREWIDPSVLRTIRRRSLARLRHEVEPVESETWARFVLDWQGIVQRERGIDATGEAVAALQGAPLVASSLERDILPARVEQFEPADLDYLVSSGEVLWLGLEPLGERDGRIALFLTRDFSRLAPALREKGDATPEGAELRIVEHLRARGASFFPQIHSALGGFPNETLDALWSLVWKGLVVNDSLHALRAWIGGGKKSARQSRRRGRTSAFRSGPPGSEGRWSLIESVAEDVPPTEVALATAQQLLQRYGVLPREALTGERIDGGFSTVYPVLKQLEEAGKIRRGYFVGGLAAAQFAVAGAIDLLRSHRDEEIPPAAVLAATDPANPYGTTLPWPKDEKRPSRSAGTHVILAGGRLAAWLARGARQILVWLPEDEPERGHVSSAVANGLVQLIERQESRRALWVEEIDGRPAGDHPIATALRDAGFEPTPRGLLLKRVRGGDAGG